jgi:hypothetical protein
MWTLRLVPHIRRITWFLEDPHCNPLTRCSGRACCSEADTHWLHCYSVLGMARGTQDISIRVMSDMSMSDTPDMLDMLDMLKPAATAARIFRTYMCHISTDLMHTVPRTTRHPDTDRS